MRIALLAALVAVSFAPASAQDAEPTSTIAQVLEADGRFTVLLGAVETAGLGNALSNAGPLTVFAPTDSAFAALPEGTLDALTPDDLRAVILGHVVEGAVSSSAAAEVGEAVSVSGVPLVFSTESGLSVNGAPVLEGDVAATNGVVHVLDAVLLPPPSAPIEDGM
ncbi:fasciclin domain-containing protein [Rubrivirga sp.]|uniref:fasciclin domain-containing protein n=1 Tax=Rubrivirga sp. TaxID=1885344 RepID=UPI003C78ED65